MTTVTQTPPEKCPVCGAKASTVNHVRRLFACGAGWSYSFGGDGWFSPCAYAMTAALRVGATLEPTPLELAEKALVGAAVVMQAADEAFAEMHFPRDIKNNQWEPRRLALLDARGKFAAATTAYRAELAKVAP